MTDITLNTRAPSHRVYTVKGEGKTARWIEIGAAWANSDGNGFSVTLDALPNDGRLVVRVPSEKKSIGKGGQ